MTEHNPYRRSGQAMMIIGWLIALALLTLFFRNLQEARENPNRKPASQTASGFREVVLKRNYQHHYLVSGYINEQPVVFLVDTGATHVAMSTQMAARLGLKEGAPELHNTANGRVETRSAMIDKLEIGPITLTKVRASISPGMSMNEVLLGMSALKDVEFVHRGGELTLRQAF